MISELFHAVVFDPIYNLLIAAIAVLPTADVGLSVIFVTIVVKVLLLPVSLKAARTQRVMRDLAKPLKEIKEKFKDRQEQALKTMELYREKNVNPFSSIFVLMLQLPVIIGLFLVFSKGGLPELQTDILYGFVPVPAAINMHFLGLIDMAGRSALLAFLAGASQFVLVRLSIPKPEERKENASFQDDLARSMQLQMRFMLPVIITFVAYFASAAVALYWITSNIFAIGQEFFIKKQLATHHD